MRRAILGWRAIGQAFGQLSLGAGSARLGCFAALAAAGEAGAYLARNGLSGLFNDFDFCWAASRLVTRGGNPYDLARMHEVLSHAGLHLASGLGYVYPLFVAYMLVPLGWLPPLAAGLIFSVVSLAAFAVAVALLLAPLQRLWWPERLLSSGPPQHRPRPA